MMLRQWPALFIHCVIVAEAVALPAAMFSPCGEPVYPAAAMR
jgi:hypothetical protein